MVGEHAHQDIVGQALYAFVRILRREAASFFEFTNFEAELLDLSHQLLAAGHLGPVRSFVPAARHRVNGVLIGRAVKAGGTRIFLQCHGLQMSLLCPGCDKTFPSDAKLRRHLIRVHSGRPYRCAEPGCGASFKQWANLYRHRMIHTEKTFACPKQGCKYRATFQFDVDKHYKTHTGPFCVTCDRYVVKATGDLCGFCAAGSNFGAKERAVFQHLADRSALLSHWVRDTPLGCKNQRRPDGYLDLHVAIDGASVLFVLEVDENEHRYYNPSCELKRLEEIQERHGGALYLIRYNPDQPGGLDADKLDTLADRCLDILEADHVNAAAAFGGMLIEYHGYSKTQTTRLRQTWIDSQKRPLL